MKVVLDTNVLVSGIFWRGTAREVLALWVQDRFQVFVSAAILEEYERVINETEHWKKSGLADGWRMFIAEKSVMLSPEDTPRYSRDSDDDKFIHCAVAAGARYLVSGDKDLLTLKEAAGVEILTPRAFLRSLP